MSFALEYSTDAAPRGSDGEAQRRWLRGRVVLPERHPAPHPVVLIAHGYTSFMDWGFFPVLSRHLADHGIASLRFNFSGSGIGADLCSVTETETFARNSYLHELDDLQQLRRELEAGRWPELDPQRCSVLGHSRGGAMGLVHAAEHGGYRTVVTWAAMDRILNFTPERLATWRQQGYLKVMHWTARRRLRLDAAVLHAAEAARQRLDIAAACQRLELPQLIVMGDADRRLDFAVSENLHRAGGKHSRLCRITGGDHTFGARHPCVEPLPPPLAEALEVTCEHLLRYG